MPRSALTLTLSLTLTPTLHHAQVNCTLTELDVSSNGLGDDGAAHFAAVLRGNTTLAAVDLSDNGVSEATRELLRGAWGSRDPARLQVD